MKKRDRIIINAGDVLGLKLTWSGNWGEWSKGTPYAKNDVPFDPISVDKDSIDVALAAKLKVDFGLYGRRKTRLMIALMAASIRTT